MNIPFLAHLKHQAQERLANAAQIQAAAWGLSPKFRNTLVGATLLLGVAAYGNRGLWNLLRLRNERTQLSGEVSRLQSQISDLQAEFHAYRPSGPAVERTAREQLDLIRPGETVYKFGPASR